MRQRKDPSVTFTYEATGEPWDHLTDLEDPTGVPTDFVYRSAAPFFNA